MKKTLVSIVKPLLLIAVFLAPLNLLFAHYASAAHLKTLSTIATLCAGISATLFAFGITPLTTMVGMNNRRLSQIFGNPEIAQQIISHYIILEALLIVSMVCYVTLLFFSETQQAYLIFVPNLFFIASIFLFFRVFQLFFEMIQAAVTGASQSEIRFSLRGKARVGGEEQYLEISKAYFTLDS
ncbi:hypothetical protein [Pseudobacteriovorax antillogorgiicola]|uniref:Uncharacterized protein n=1 Tax=Pseudobacteriovorax antillogorgiicola TaxID=1513793 RepID=A0A1Y6CUP4_9BACT|nr:hypothetical protein [Pseudobacteriovorax antillogorgiicola]TCS44254.1 hypothetical protein EDD56_13454 [Pseudobacteriovorax antillogorgiicola]SMF80765.1 hypothetical protein SAMN06296036_13555 [Pseudobacteriovorax antillogorgiicola]